MFAKGASWFLVIANRLKRGVRKPSPDGPEGEKYDLAAVLPELPSNLSISVRAGVSFPGDARGVPHSYWLTHELHIVPTAATSFKGKGQPALPRCQWVRKYSNTRHGPKNTVTDTAMQCRENGEPFHAVTGSTHTHSFDTQINKLE